MKIIQFTAPVSKDNSVVVQEDILPYFYNYLHRHNEIQLTLIIKGEGTLIAGNYTQPFEPGDVYIIGANQPHIFKGDARYFKEPATDNSQAIHIFFNPEGCLSPLFSLPELESVKKFIALTENGLQLPARYTHIVSREMKRISKLSGFDRLFCFMKLLRFLAVQVESWRCLATGLGKFEVLMDTEGIRMNDVYEYTIENYAEDISLSKIARIANITPYAFCKYFKKHTRKTYFNFLNEIRVTEACKKMIRGDCDNIAHVAYTTGFNSIITFNRVFKKTTGMSPSEYTRLYKCNRELTPVSYPI
ncbi:transcriptional regulator, AraC family [Filimonas lacunae]|uniref:Transcriptional regulator, AraC family n=1 Tax=Filimonas lacunae TaxID=477680 RepID=A0A173MEP6_9BACT|nr:AraC family transcriptional regulator [Filimonas lacunae]BAV05901.1 transcriptional regulator [Filimonas lacunae]SIT34544.1 transcriptional regulator, AraC family [Filimonas lacunae]